MKPEKLYPVDPPPGAIPHRDTMLNLTSYVSIIDILLCCNYMLVHLIEVL